MNGDFFILLWVENLVRLLNSSLVLLFIVCGGAGVEPRTRDDGPSEMLRSSVKETAFVANNLDVGVLCALQGRARMLLSINETPRKIGV